MSSVVVYSMHGGTCSQADINFVRVNFVTAPTSNIATLRAGFCFFVSEGHYVRKQLLNFFAV